MTIHLLIIGIKRYDHIIRLGHNHRLIIHTTQITLLILTSCILRLLIAICLILIILTPLILYSRRLSRVISTSAHRPFTLILRLDTPHLIRLHATSHQLLTNLLLSLAVSRLSTYISYHFIISHRSSRKRQSHQTDKKILPYIHQNQY